MNSVLPTFPRRTKWSVFKAHIKRTAEIVRNGKPGVLVDWRYWRQFYRLNRSAWEVIKAEKIA